MGARGCVVSIQHVCIPRELRDPTSDTNSACVRAEDARTAGEERVLLRVPQRGRKKLGQPFPSPLMRAAW